jgi:hypothetical protein
MGKAKREAKRARRAARGTEAEGALIEADRSQLRRQRWRKGALLAVPLITASAAGGAYLALEDGRVVGVVLLVGVAVFFLLALSAIGSSVQPRDRDRAGSIDFGNRR